MAAEHIDVLIVGAGMSGIGAGVHLKKSDPDSRFLILESRDAIGGTWDLFRYPGIRCDSDMHTLGYAFKPWIDSRAIADGPAILQYIHDTAREYGIDRHIRFKHRVVRATWSSQTSLWTVDVERNKDPELAQFTCRFLYFCSGYYNYEQGYTPNFAGQSRFQGRIVHPQQWGSDVDCTNKRVVVIGSGATAVTLAPALAHHAAHVTLLQRTPTYMVTVPSSDQWANRLNRILPAKVAYAITRCKNVLQSTLFVSLSRRYPYFIKRQIIKRVQQQLGKGVDVSKLFSPPYKPWQQRVCMVPDGELFKMMNKGLVSIVTDRIETFTESGIQLRSGKTLEADVIVTATGLDLLALGGASIEVDGQAVVLKNKFSYKGMMLAGVPNMAYVMGYTTATWTLKADLTSDYVARLLKHMRHLGATHCMPKPDPSTTPNTRFDFAPGYFVRAAGRFPKQGNAYPWKLHKNHVQEALSLRLSGIDDGTLVFGKASEQAQCLNDHHR